MFETGCCGHLHSSRHIYCLISQLCTHVTHELSCRAALQAWNRKEVALFWDTKTSSLFVRVLTQELMTTPLMHYRTCADALCKSCC